MGCRTRLPNAATGIGRMMVSLKPGSLHTGLSPAQILIIPSTDVAKGDVVVRSSAPARADLPATVRSVW